MGSPNLGVFGGASLGANTRYQQSVATNYLSDTQIRALKPAAKPYKARDGEGLFLLIQPSGAKLWRLAYRVHGKQKTLAIGVYPHVGLGDARDKRDDAKKLLAAGDIRKALATP